MQIKPRMNRFLPLLLFCLTGLVAAQDQSAQPKPQIRYGQNAAAASYARVNRIKLYYETYGDGPVMLQIHGNGQSIAAMRNQISFFSTHYKVIAADSRGHGKSEMGEGRLTYEIMAEDLNALLESLGQKRIHVLGWSDGGIIGLLLAIHHPDKVGKLAIMGANLEPSGAYEWAVQWAEKQSQQANQMLAKGDASQPWKTYQQHLDLLLKQPHISLGDLRKILAPTLVMAGDKDVIQTAHTVSIFENLPNAHLCIFPGATHMIPVQDPQLFNQTVERFFAKPYARPDTKDIFK